MVHRLQLQQSLQFRNDAAGTVQNVHVLEFAFQTPSCCNLDVTSPRYPTSYAAVQTRQMSDDNTVVRMMRENK